MRNRAALLPILLIVAGIILPPQAGAQEQDARAQGPIKIKNCQTISLPGSYKLANNIGSVSGDCLVITANSVTIDLAGFSIGFGGGTAIAVAPSSGLLQGIAVRNGSIFAFSNGVDLGSAGGSIGEGLRVDVAQPSSSIGISALGIVRNNTVTGSRVTGISATGIVTGNYAFGRITGIAAGEGSTVIGNTAGGAVNGIIVACPSNVTDNTAIGSQHNLVLNGDGCSNTNNVAP